MKNIKLMTKIPGPNSLRLLKEKKSNVSVGYSNFFPIFIKEAKDALIKDVDGNVFIDFYGGIGANNSGHSNPLIVKAIKQQLDKFTHTCFSEVGYEGFVELCKKLNQITPGNFKKKSALFNTGAEAVENAIKAARKYTGKSSVISFEHGFHGRTLLTLTMTSKIKPYKFGFGPFAPEIYKLPYPYLYRRPDNLNEEGYIDYLLENIEGTFFNGRVDPDNVACLVMELVTGEGGFIVAPKRYVQGLSKICKKNNIVLIIDEVQTGFCRSGRFFASEHYNIEPDIILTAKSLSNGIPLSAVTGRKEIMDSVQENGFGGTFSGNPLACVSALEVIKFMQKEKLWLKAEKIGNIVLNRFNKIKINSKFIGDVRGLGAMCGMEFVKDKKGKEPNEEFTKTVIKRCYENGLLILKTGIFNNAIRTLMPLVITDDQLGEGLDVFERAVLK
ncbi:4-aminobutyrate--2-oxoglutarate transaminase [Candidatus Woesearchaeota archaeon]|nr:4-aminobutyrate--2-oxoglutarate transaminase [Candidatus Woesearchaeota archaeon]